MLPGTPAAAAAAEAAAAAASFKGLHRLNAHIQYS